MLSKQQKDALCFYEGDVNSLQDPFLCDPKAYVTWNALLFDGIETELARSKEGRFLNPDLLKEPDRIIGLSCDLLSVMKPHRKQQRVYRVERLIDYRKFQNSGSFTSFLSTSSSHFLASYQDKIDLVLMEVILEADTICADFSKLLDVYQKQEESEILLPPFLKFQETELIPDEKILQITDRNQQPAKVYVEIHLGEFDLEYTSVNNPFTDENIQAGIRCYQAWNTKQCPDQADIDRYLVYKQGIQGAVKEYMKQQLSLQDRT